METFEEWCNDREIVLNELSPKLLTMAYKIWGEECFVEGQRYEAENASLRARLEKAVELPCKVGDKLFVVMPELYGNQIIEALVNQIIFNHGETQILVYYDIHQEGRIHRLYESYFGKTLFFTREAAEARLAELKGEEKNG